MRPMVSIRVVTHEPIIFWLICECQEQQSRALPEITESASLTGTPIPKQQLPYCKLLWILNMQKHS